MIEKHETLFKELPEDIEYISLIIKEYTNRADGKRLNLRNTILQARHNFLLLYEFAKSYGEVPKGSTLFIPDFWQIRDYLTKEDSDVLTNYWYFMHDFARCYINKLGVPELKSYPGTRYTKSL